MKRLFNFCKHNLSTDSIKKNILTIIIFIIILILIIFTSIFKKKDGDLDSTLIGVAVAFVIGFRQISMANKNMKDNIQIRRAEFTNQFIKDFQKLMPDLSFCAQLYCEFNDHADDKVKELNKRLMEKDRFNFSIADYNKLKRELGIEDKVIYESKKEFHNNVENIISIATNHYNKTGLSEFCKFHMMHNEYIENKERIERNKSQKSKPLLKINKISKTNILKIRKIMLTKIKPKKIKMTKKEESEDTYKLKKFYANCIVEKVQSVVNELECNTLSDQFDLLDYDKITNLIFVPFHYYISNLYIVMMENKIEHEKRNCFIYSNIKRLCDQMVSIKEQIDTDMNAENLKSEQRKEELVTNATKSKKLM